MGDDWLLNVLVKPIGWFNGMTDVSGSYFIHDIVEMVTYIHTFICLQVPSESQRVVGERESRLHP